MQVRASWIQIKAGYFNLRSYPQMLEKIISLSIVSPLLFAGEFYLHHFYIKPQKFLEISEEDEGVIIKDSIDTLVLKDQLWLMVIESNLSLNSITKLDSVAEVELTPQFGHT
ncbi:MAG: hypothetical protein WCF82_26675 [Microcoleus sp.]